MEKSSEETRALAEAARLREVVERLRCLAATTAAELEANSPSSSSETPTALGPSADR
jgi:hypothetical protein